MFNPLLKVSCAAMALCVVAGSSTQVYAQHHHHHGGGYSGGGSHHHHGGGGIYIRSGGIGIGFGTGYGNPYGGIGYSSGFGYSPYRNYYSPAYRPVYGYSSSVYVTPQVVTPQYVTPQPRVVYQPSPTVVYQSPTVQSSGVVIQSARITPADSGTRTSLPAVTQGARAHLNVLADAVSERTGLLLNDLNAYYKNNPQFDEVYRDTGLLAASAKQIPSLAADSQSLLAAMHDLNTLFNALQPAIEHWQPAGGGSAASHLSGVKSALQLLSIDAGYDPNHPVSRPVQVPAQTATPAATAKEPTPVDAIPAPDTVPAP